MEIARIVYPRPASIEVYTSQDGGAASAGTAPR